MNTYPGLPTQFGSRPRWIRKAAIDEATNGTPRMRVLHDRRRGEFPLVHPNITRAERDALLAFYDANAASTVLYERFRDGILESFIVIMTGPPQEVYERGGRYTMTMTLREI